MFVDLWFVLDQELATKVGSLITAQISLEPRGERGEEKSSHFVTRLNQLVHVWLIVFVYF